MLKMYCDYKEPNEDGTVSLHLSAVMEDEAKPENTKFWEATPSGTLEFQCCNPAAVEMFEQGKEYYIQVGPAEMFETYDSQMTAVEGSFVLGVDVPLTSVYPVTMMKDTERVVANLQQLESNLNKLMKEEITRDEFIEMQFPYAVTEALTLLGVVNEGEVK